MECIKQFCGDMGGSGAGLAVGLDSFRGLVQP